MPGESPARLRVRLVDTTPLPLKAHLQPAEALLGLCNFITWMDSDNKVCYMGGLTKMDSHSDKSS